MERKLSVYFGIDRIYIALISFEPDGLKLEYINSTLHPFDLEFPEDENSKMAGSELNGILMTIFDNFEDISSLNITISVDNAFVRQFPGSPDLSRENLLQLLNFEIRQAFKQFNYEDFIINVVPLSRRLDGKQFMLSAMFHRKNIDSCKELFVGLDLPIENIDISQFNAHSCFLYNYPEYKEKTVAIFGIQSKFVDLSVLQNGAPIYYSLLKCYDRQEFLKKVSQEFTELMTHYVDYIESAFLFGTGLNTELFGQIDETLKGLVMNVEKMNAFRMFKTDLGKREREYCSRTAHIYPPCIGAVIPPYHKVIKIS